MDITNITESFDDFGDLSSSDEDCNEEEQGMNREMVCTMEDGLSITTELANANLEAAGTFVPEESEKITIAKNQDLMCEKVAQYLDAVLEEVDLPYELAEFQKVAIHAIGQMKNVILISPTGSGKMVIPLLATRVLRKRLNAPKGVAIITQPLSSIMKEKINNTVCSAAVLSMKGDLSCNSKSDIEEDAILSCELDLVLDGKIQVLFGHPESFDTKLGQYILRQLQKSGRW